MRSHQWCQCSQVVLAGHVHERLNLSLSGIQLDWDQVGSSLRATSLGASGSAVPPALARQMQSLSSLKRLPTRERRATDSNLAFAAPEKSSLQPSVSFTAMTRTARVRRATEDNVLLGRQRASSFTAMGSMGRVRRATDDSGISLDCVGTEPPASVSMTKGPSSPSEDEEDCQSERLPIGGGASALSASLAVSGTGFNGLSRSFSRRRRATDSDMRALESIHEGLGPEEALGSSSAGRGAFGTAGQDPEVQEVIPQIRSVHRREMGDEYVFRIGPSVSHSELLKLSVYHSHLSHHYSFRSLDVTLIIQLFIDDVK